MDWLARALRDYTALSPAQRAKFAAAMPLLEDADEAKTPRTWNVDANARTAVYDTEKIDTSHQRSTSPTALVKEAILYGYQKAAQRNGGAVLNKK